MFWLKSFLKVAPRAKRLPLFALGESPILYNTFLNGMKALLSKVGVRGNFANHSLRWEDATHMSMSGCNVTEVKQRSL